jgi:hypothetical protein
MRDHADPWPSERDGGVALETFPPLHGLVHERVDRKVGIGVRCGYRAPRNNVPGRGAAAAPFSMMTSPDFTVVM